MPGVVVPMQSPTTPKLVAGSWNVNACPDRLTAAKCREFRGHGMVFAIVTDADPAS